MSLSASGPGDLGFAFPHAVNLAEFGQSPMDKKIGVYQHLPPTTRANFAHRIHLLHGTNASRSRTSTHVSEHVAKGKCPCRRTACGSFLTGPQDLESTSLPRICLALDVLIHVPNEDVVPAVDTRLQTLLQHES